MSTSQFVNRVLIVAAVVLSIALTWLLRDILISALFAVIIVLVRELYSCDALGLRPADVAELPAPAPRPAKQLSSRRRSA